MTEAAVANSSEDDEVQKFRVIDALLTKVLPILFVLCVASTVLAMHLYGWEAIASDIFKAVDAKKEQRVLQAAVINILLAATITLCLPGPMLLVLLNGFFFGFWIGFPLTFASELCAALCSWVIARFCFKQSIRSYLLRNRLAKDLILICEEDPSGSLLLLYRFLGMPVWLKNYSMAILDIPLLTFVLVFVPASILYGGLMTYVGSKAYVVADEFRKGNVSAAYDQFSGLEFLMAGLSSTALLVLGFVGWRQLKARRSDADETLPLMTS
mmetsp:Transcript_23779/g.55399  ORF Transcript_23779/g.55399 Transcript_23779/m.55399 type:complete len:269 (+) Transcript_23779:78-884(+)|eukprot:CAMPEP_0178391916 /NCGR_PEP_ID=MMETSP0689_2-20121128/11409_1 /TAXON_ID=160604 /ORGANISM="Amphidinium massartii, Strain CS-259" /LENGTH=268 /DNA_ID=CAMNT_0020012473 /DNA_START=70 /DNA_END=876 /DNA_ORIENTATION=+